MSIRRKTNVGNVNPLRPILIAFGLAALVCALVIIGAPALTGRLSIQADAAGQYRYVCTHGTWKYNMLAFRYVMSCPAGMYKNGISCCRRVSLTPTGTPTPKPVITPKAIPYVSTTPAAATASMSPPVPNDSCSKAGISCGSAVSYCEVRTNEILTCVCEGSTKTWVKTPCGNKVCHTEPFGTPSCRDDITPTPTPTGVCPKIKYNCRLGTNFCGANNSVVTCVCDGDTRTWKATPCGDKKCVYGGVPMVSSKCE